MDTVFVKVMFDLDCEWEGLPPVYRVYVNDELFAERTWVWTDQYLQEMLQMQAPPGQYRIRVTPVGPTLARFQPSNWKIEHGPAHWVKKGLMEIS